MLLGLVYKLKIGLSVSEYNSRIAAVKLKLLPIQYNTVECKDFTQVMCSRVAGLVV